MDAARIAALLEPFLDRPLAPGQLRQISTYIDLLLRWNARINLTAIRNPDEIVTRHFGESFFLARHLFPSVSALCHPASSPCHPERSRAMSEATGSAESKDPYSCTPSASLSEAAPPSAPFAKGGNSARQVSPATKLTSRDSFRTQSIPGAQDPSVLSEAPRVIDLGSGAGFPALPLKIWAPHIHLVLIESNHKKATFLREIARALTLTDIDVINDRAETLSARNSPQFPLADVVTFRAVERFERVLPLAATFLAPFARLALLITSSQLPHLTTLPNVTWHTISVPHSNTGVLSIGTIT